MKGLDTLSPLPDGKGWGPPTALPASVAALKRLRELWLGGAGNESVSQCQVARSFFFTLPPSRNPAERA